MSMKEFRRAHGAGRLFVIDVRSPKSYQAGHIPGAVNVPLADTARRAAEVRAQAGNRRIVTYCSCPTEHLSTEAAVELAKHGVMNVSALVGGYLDWVAGGGRVERSSDLPFGLVVEKPLQRVLINAYCSPMTVWSVETMRIGPR
jgi:rhodanese-related sulfurtransferase